MSCPSTVPPARAEAAATALLPPPLSWSSGCCVSSPSSPLSSWSLSSPTAAPAAVSSPSSRRGGGGGGGGSSVVCCSEPLSRDCWICLNNLDFPSPAVVAVVGAPGMLSQPFPLAVLPPTSDGLRSGSFSLMLGFLRCLHSRTSPMPPLPPLAPAATPAPPSPPLLPSPCLAFKGDDDNCLLFSALRAALLSRRRHRCCCCSLPFSSSPFALGSLSRGRAGADKDDHDEADDDQDEAESGDKRGEEEPQDAAATARAMSPAFGERKLRDFSSRMARRTWRGIFARLESEIAPTLRSRFRL
mmetsp:Transcript_9908/g.19870  ORF Transcript_9908/g.19870 Transcript_9908/m.19870 type:complete len:300 (+) Transcript_9908:68-967(+)